MRKLYLVFGMALIFCLSGCNDWLDVRQETEQKEEEQFATYKGFCDALTGCYMTLGEKAVYGEKLTMSNIESLANLWNPFTTDPGTERSADYYLSLHDYESDAAREAMQSVWSKLFNVIVQANVIIKHVEENKDVFDSEAARSVILGEAYAIRAYCQLDVLRLFGQVPQKATIQVRLPYSETTAFDEKPTYYAFEDYVSKLKYDLNQAESLLKDNDPIFEYTFSQLNFPTSNLLDDSYLYYRQARFNYWAVKALQARTYLYLGEKELAYGAAMAVISAKGSDGNPVMTLSGASDIVGQGYKACPNECLLYLSKYDIKSVANILIGGNDVRANSTRLYITATQLADLFKGQETDSHNRYRYVWNRNVKDAANKSCAAILKYYFADNASNQMLYYQIIPMLRMSEVYLIAIETTKNLVEANQLYADYMRDRDVVLNENAFGSLDDVQGIIVDEYRREFFAEGQTFYMYKRLNIKDVLWYTKGLTEQDYVLWKCVSTEFNA